MTKDVIRRTLTATGCGLLGVLAGCSGAPATNTCNSATAAGSAADPCPTGGSTAGGATNASASGGASTTTGGDSTLGGSAASGGSTNASATGGASTTTGGDSTLGGSAASGGSANASATGGASTTTGGDSTLGGSAASGGATSGGASSTAPSQCIVYVKSDGGDTKDGSSWSQAFATVQKGLNTAALRMLSGTYPVCEIWAAAGTYLPTEDSNGSNAPSDARTKTFHFKSKVALYGGFSGTETSRDQRDILAHETILSGDLGVTNDTSDNAYHVVTGISSATVDGLTITQGNANGTATDANVGAGMYNPQTSPMVANCKFTKNTATAGAGMYNYNSEATIKNCTFQDNIADNGGGMCNGGNSSWGPTISGCTFIGNMVFNAGGGMYNGVPVTVKGSTFQGNAAAEGGAAYTYRKIASTFTNCTFVGNTAGNGGAISNDYNDTSITYSVFLHNTATENLGQGYGGGVFNGYTSTGAIVNCTFVGNSAVTGGAIYNDSSPMTLMNLIVWGNTATSYPSIKTYYISGASLPTVSYSDVEGGCTYTNLCTLNTTAGNINVDPMFVDITSGNLQLQAASPCIDTGYYYSYNQTDIVGQALIDVQGVGHDGSNYMDMGAYEYHP